MPKPNPTWLRDVVEKAPPWPPEKTALCIHCGHERWLHDHTNPRIPLYDRDGNMNPWPKPYTKWCTMSSCACPMFNATEIDALLEELVK